MSDLLPEQEPPDQANPAPPNIEHGDVDIKVTCSPSPGQPTIIPTGQDSVWFSVLVDYPLGAAGSGWQEPQVCIWHNHNGEHEWNELHLKPTSGVQENILVIDCKPNDSEKKGGILFRGELTGLPKHAHKVSFTVKYRLGTESDWRWIKDTTGLGDGELLYQTCADFKKHSSYELSHFFSDISSDIEVSSESPETSHTQLWSLTSPVGPAEGLESGYQQHRLGRVNHSARWFALVRLWTPWLAPRHGKGGEFELDKDGVLLSFLRDDGLHVVCLAISGVQDILTTFTHEDDNVIIKGRNDREEAGTNRVLIAVAESFELANCAVMYHARKVISQYSSVSNELLAELKQAETLTRTNDPETKPSWFEEWYDGLSYCTWNGLGQDLTAQKIYDALDHLSSKNINITNLIIDDNWQSLSTGESQFKRGWSDFEANAWGFPDGLKKTTEQIRLRHSNVKHIAVWHALLGYWGGIDPEGAIAKKYKAIEVEKEAGVAGGKFTVVAEEDVKKMYSDFYAFLSSSGVDAVKTDAQFFLDLLLHAPDRRSLISTYQDAWTIAHLRHLSSRAISCMSQHPQSLFHNQLPKNKPRLLVRNSDDFFPEVEASHPWHIFCNAHNSLFTQHLNALPDWDMFQTSHPWSKFHAAARCVSGGPIYITDKPGEHDIELIGQMTAQTVTGKTMILRPHIVGKSVNIYSAYSDLALLKIGTYIGMSGSGSGILGVFNVSQQTLREFIHLDSFPGIEKDEDYVIGSFCSNRVSTPMRKGQDHAMVSQELEPRGWDILTAYPIRKFELASASKPLGVALMGLVEKMTGAAAILSSDLYTESNGRLRISVTLKALGVLGIWVSDLERRSVEDHFLVMIGQKVVPVACVKASEPENVAGGEAGVLQIDVARAWKELGLEPGWSNEVEVEIVVS